MLLDYEHIVLLPITQEVSTRWLSLLKRVEIRGAQIFVLQIAATMLAHGVTTLLTYNGTDFEDVVEVNAAEPPSDLSK